MNNLMSEQTYNVKRPASKLTEEDIVKFTRRKWGRVDPKFRQLYDGITTKINLSEFEANDVVKLITFIVDLYINSVKLEPINKVVANNVKESIVANLNSIRHLSTETDLLGFIAQLEAMVDTINVTSDKIDDAEEEI